MKKSGFIKLIAFFLVLSNLVFGKNDETEASYSSIDNSIVIDRITNDDIEVTVPSLLFTFKDATIKVRFKNLEHPRLLLNKGKINFIIDGIDKELNFNNGEATFQRSFSDNNSLTIYAEEFGYSTKVTAYPLWVFLAPFILIVLWIVIRQMNKKKEIS